MAKTAYLNTRIEPEIKKKAEKILSSLGLSTSDAIGIFLRQVVLRKGLPFEVSVPNAVTVAALKELEAGQATVHEGATSSVFDEIVAEK